MSAPIMTHIHVFFSTRQSERQFFIPKFWLDEKHYLLLRADRLMQDFELIIMARRGWGRRRIENWVKAELHVQLQHILLLTRWRRMILSSALLDHLVSVSQWLEFEHPCLRLSLSQPHPPIWDVNMHFVNLPLVQFSSQNLHFTSFTAVFVQNIKFRILTSFAAFCRSKCSVM